MNIHPPLQLTLQLRPLLIVFNIYFGYFILENHVRVAVFGDKNQASQIFCGEASPIFSHAIANFE